MKESQETGEKGSQEDQERSNEADVIQIIGGYC
jgi:hypothetical protein